ncbi:MAG: hypothetical protein ACRC10_08990 [Thermoguttaceae bacterium]
MFTTSEISPDLLAFEAKLGEIHPAENTDRLKRLQTVALLEMCRTSQETLQDTLRQVGEQNIPVSLRRYLRLERMQALLIGLLLGLIVGVIINLAMMFFLVKNLPTREMPLPNQSVRAVSVLHLHLPHSS